MNPWLGIHKTTASSYQSFLQGLTDPMQMQQRRLNAILQTNVATHFGQQHDFASLSDPDNFRERVPLLDYSLIKPYIERMMQGSEMELLAEPVLLYEETGGSIGGIKHIPYTASSLTGFHNAISPWLHNLAHYHPQLEKAYFAISPAARPSRLTANNIPIGAANDGIYFGEALQTSFTTLSVVPPQLSELSDMNEWERYTLRYLLQTENLTLMSVWSPTFLLTLMNAMTTHADVLLRELHDGTASQYDWERHSIPRPERSRLVENALTGDKMNTQVLWPKLQLISCWTHANSASFIPALRNLFPQVAIQGKGLLATEGVTSIPLCQYDYPVLAIDSGFYEFLDTEQNSHLAHEVIEGQEYEVVMTVPGLYRYRTGDRVKICGWAKATPQLEFMGRTGTNSDLVGEKLTEAFVTDCLHGIEGFAMLAPCLLPDPHYCLFAEQVNEDDRDRIEQRLQLNPQYAYARRLGQLGELRHQRIQSPWVRYQQWAINQGQRLGDIKPPVLRVETDWDAIFNK